MDIDHKTASKDGIDENYVDYQKIADAMKYYAALGYIVISVPWIVTAAAGEATRPKHVRALDTCLGRLPASGENSFLSMIMEGTLPPGKYVCCTPCFRDEEKLDALHKNAFIKVELIDTVNCDFQQLLNDAYGFLSQYLPCEVIDFEDGTKDIVTAKDGIELGSYGVREINPFGKWAYGTGLAEPRLSYVLQIQKQ